MAEHKDPWPPVTMTLHEAVAEIKLLNLRVAALEEVCERQLAQLTYFKAMSRENVYG